MKKAFGIIFLVAFAITAMFIQRAFCASSDEVVKLFVGEPWVVSVNGLARIAIGNPAVIDVGNVSKNELTVNPKIPQPDLAAIVINIKLKTVAEPSIIKTLLVSEKA